MNDFIYYKLLHFNICVFFILYFERTITQKTLYNLKERFYKF